MKQRRRGLAVLVGLFVGFGLTLSWGREFVVPSAKERLRAVGELKGLGAGERVAYSEQGFVPLGKPVAGEWLAEHPEAGQGFDSFLTERVHKPTAERRVLVLQPIGSFDSVGRHPSLESLSKLASVFFELPVRIEKPLSWSVVGARVRDGVSGEQALSTDVLNYLGPLVPKDAYCVLGITMRDLYPKESWNYVFGQASLRDRVGVYSFARYDPAFFGGVRREGVKSLILLRSLKVLVHETGHMFGIQHCVYYRCVMNGSNSLVESDSQPLHACPVCLRKLQSSLGFDVADRYGRLAKVYESEGLLEQAKWVAKRAKDCR